ncbi:MAG: hypothetical protein IPI75_11655 [Gammaproteobacteria bacterium]|nr:hypothetical protein [Gammaproteobacteria bacterium]
MNSIWRLLIFGWLFIAGCMPLRSQEQQVPESLSWALATCISAQKTIGNPHVYDPAELGISNGMKRASVDYYEGLPYVGVFLSRGLRVVDGMNANCYLSVNDRRVILAAYSLYPGHEVRYQYSAYPYEFDTEKEEDEFWSKHPAHYFVIDLTTMEITDMPGNILGKLNPLVKE